MLYIVKGHENKEHLVYNFHLESINYKSIFIDNLDDLKVILKSGPKWDGKNLIKTSFILVLSSKVKLDQCKGGLKSDRRNDFYILVDSNKEKQYSLCLDLNNKAKEYEVIPNEVHLNILKSINSIFKNKKDYEIFKEFFFDKPFLLSQYLPYIQSVILKGNKVSTEFVYSICNYSTTKFYYPPKVGSKCWSRLALLDKKDLWTLFIDRGERCSILHNYLTQYDRCLPLIQPLNILVRSVKEDTIIDLRSAAILFERWASQLKIYKTRSGWNIDLSHEHITELERYLNV